MGGWGILTWPFQYFKMSDEHVTQENDDLLLSLVSVSRWCSGPSEPAESLRIRASSIRHH